MAARARVRFGSSGSRGVINRFLAVGGVAARARRKTNLFNVGLGRSAHQAGRTAARFAMFARGLKNLRESVSGAERPWHRFGRGVEGVLSALSRRFAQYRRSVWFYQRAVMFYGRSIKRIGSIFRRTSEDVASGVGRMGRGGGRRPPPRGPAAGIVGDPAPLLSTAGAAGKARGALFKLASVFGAVGIAAAGATAAIAVVGTALGALYAVAGYFTAKFAARIIKGFFGIRETFRMYEISLGGIVRNTKATAKIMSFAMKYAAEYPAMFEDVVDAFRGLASMPTLKPLFRKADYEDLKGIMDIVQGLATLKPQQGVAGAMMALREALSGQMRSMRMRFEVNVREMAEAAGYSFTEITHDATKALKAIRKFVELNVPAEAMASMAMTVGVQYGNLFDKYRTFINAMMKSTGAYWAVVTALKNLNEWLGKVFKAPGVIAFAQKVGNAMREIVSAFEQAMGLINWDKYLKAGDVIGALNAVCATIREFFAVLWAQVDSDTKNALREITRTMGSLLYAGIKVIFLGIWEMIKMGFWDVGKASWKLFKQGFSAEKGSIQKQLREAMPPHIRRLMPKLPSEETPWKGRWPIPTGGTTTALDKIIEKSLKAMGMLKPEPVKVGEEITKVENRRLVTIKMALRMFDEWSVKYKEQKKDAEGLLAVSRKVADVLMLPALIKQYTALAKKVDENAKLLKDVNLTKKEKIQLERKDLELQDEAMAMGSRIAVAKTLKAEDLNKLLQQRVKAQDAILEKEKKITEQMEKTRKKAAEQVVKIRKEIGRAVAERGVGMVGAILSFYEKWRDALGLMKKTAMGVKIPGFGRGVTWRKGLQEDRGVPALFGMLEKRLKGLYASELGAAGNRRVAEQLMGLYEGMYATVKGRRPKEEITAKAMGLFPKLLELQAKEATEAIADRRKQLEIQQKTLLAQSATRDEVAKLPGKMDDQITELRKIVAAGEGVKEQGVVAKAKEALNVTFRGQELVMSNVPG